MMESLKDVAQYEACFDIGKDLLDEDFSDVKEVEEAVSSNVFSNIFIVNKFANHFT